MKKKPFDVYWNLSIKCYSVIGRVDKELSATGYTSWYLREVDFVVQKARRAMVLRQKRKNVHAFLRGHRIYSQEYVDDGKSVKIGYNPYKAPFFYNLATGEEVRFASAVRCTVTDGKPVIEAIRPIYGTGRVTDISDAK